MPSAPGYVRNYAQENKYKKRPDQVKKREERNKARADMLKAGRVHKGDKMEVDHKKPLSRGGSNKASNLRVISQHKNDSYPRTASGAIAQLTAFKRKNKRFP